MNSKSIISRKIKLLPPSVEEMIPQNHPVKVMNGGIQHLDLQHLLKPTVKVIRATTEDDVDGYFGGIVPP